MLWGEAVLVERDIRVWNSKRWTIVALGLAIRYFSSRYASTPLLMREDRMLAGHRRSVTCTAKLSIELKFSFLIDSVI